VAFAAAAVGQVRQLQPDLPELAAFEQRLRQVAGESWRR